MTITPDFLPEASEFSREAAMHLCNNSCRPYHAAWSTLRQAGIITGVRTDEDFFQSQIALLAANSPRVLICGSADYAIAEQVLIAYRSKDFEPDITVVDTCATTLEQNIRYASWVGARLQKVCADIRDVQEKGCYDLITTHSVLSFMPVSEHPGIFSTWRNLLAPGGSLVFAQVFRPGHRANTVLRLNQLEIERFVERSMACYQASTLSARLSVREMKELATDFATAKQAYAVSDDEGMYKAICNAGFKIDSWQIISRDGLPYRSSFADEKDQALSLRVVARAV